MTLDVSEPTHLESDECIASMCVGAWERRVVDGTVIVQLEGRWLSASGEMGGTVV